METRKVLIPVDGTDFSLKVLPYIQRLFPPDANSLILMQVALPFAAVPDEALWTMSADIHAPLYVTYPMGTHLPRWEEIRERLQTELDKSKAQLQEMGYTVSALVHIGDPIVEIAAVVEREQVDVVAMATHGRTGLDRLLFGSIAEAALHRLRVPVLIVHPSA